MWSRCTMTCIRVVHFLPDIPFTLKISSLTLSNIRPSSLSSPLQFHFHSSPSYVILLSSHHILIPAQSPFLDLFYYFRRFLCPLILQLFYRIQLRNSAHSSSHSRFWERQFIFLCINPHVSAPYTSAGLTTVLCTFLLMFTFIFLSHNTPDTLFQFFHPICPMWVTSASSSPSSANVFSGLLSVRYN